MLRTMLSGKLSVIVLALFLVLTPISLSFGFAYYEVRAELIEKAQGGLNAKANLVAAYVDGRLKSDIAYSRAHASRPSLHNAIRTGDSDQLQFLLSEIVAGSNLFENVAIVSLAGEIIAFYPEQPGAIGADLSAQDWYIGVSQTEAPYVSDFFLTHFEPVHYTFVVATPIMIRGDTSLGYLAARMKPGYLAAAVAEAEFPDTTVYLVDDQGYLIYHPDREVTEPTDVSVLAPVQQLLPGDNGATIFPDEYSGKQMLAGYHLIDTAGWGVVIQQQLSGVLIPLQRITTVFVLLGLVGAMLAVLVGYHSWALTKKHLDTADRLRLEEELEAAYSAMLVVLNSSWQDLTELCQAILLQLKTSPGLDLGVIYLFNEKKLQPVTSIGLALPNQVSAFAQESARLNLPLTISDLAPDSPLIIETAALSIRPHEIHAFPIIYAQETIGVLELASLGRLSEPDLDIMDRLLPQLAISINNLKAHLQVAGMASQLKIANEDYSRVNDDLLSLNVKLRESQHDLIETNQKLDFASKAKSDFLANMSHELRTPLNSILGFSEVLQDQIFGEVNDKQAEYLAYIRDSGKHLLDVINDILDVAKVESGTMDLDSTQFSLNQLLQSSISMFTERAKKHSLQLTLEADQPIELFADERKVKQIMYNLLSNAVKFTPAGGSIVVRSAVSADQPDYVLVSVTDSGIGLRTEDLPRLFIEFTQLEQTFTRKHQGTGLGLALTKKLVEMHGGKIWVDSIFGQGSTFSFTLPLGQVNSAAAAGNGYCPAELPSLKDKKVLIIEDAPGEANAAEFLFASEGARCSVAADVPTGLNLALAEQPDVILLDLMFPNIDGYDFLRLMHARPEIAHTPVVILTAKSLSKKEIADLKLTVFDVARKGNISKKELIEMMKRALWCNPSGAGGGEER
ncbi:MAG TPA: ATP-binding protein [Candidatus Limnocylindrales bacterium]|nr:ATP-binding protein [Candidatus Limnocylindrales bacterium]